MIVGDKLVKIVNEKIVKSLFEGTETVGLHTPFDIDANGNFWLANENGLVRATSDGKTTLIAKRNDWKFGGLIGKTLIRSLRIDPSGQIFIGEQKDPEDPEVTRISVYDAQGQFVRWFGHAGRTPKPPEEGVNDGQVLGKTYDFAFRDGKIYVANGDPEKEILIYVPF